MMLVANMSMAILSLSNRRVVKKEWEQLKKSDQNKGVNNEIIWSYLGFGYYIELLEPKGVHPFGKIKR